MLPFHFNVIVREGGRSSKRRPEWLMYDLEVGDYWMPRFAGHDNE
jgi:hypothetical protein